VDISSSASWDVHGSVFLPVEVAEGQGTVCRLQQDHHSPGENSDTGSTDGNLRIARTGSPPGLVIAGDIDEFTYPTLAASLTWVADRGGEIHLDLAAVRYCDLAGLRALVRLSAGRGDRPEHDGRKLILHALPPHLKTVLEILGWDSMPGLVIAETTKRGWA
jgi:anti-anti-sigma regulatory factor